LRQRIEAGDATQQRAPAILHVALSGDLFQEDRIARYGEMIADMILAYFRAPDGTAAPAPLPGP
jgi:hypothetical protein